MASYKFTITSSAWQRLILEHVRRAIPAHYRGVLPHIVCRRDRGGVVSGGVVRLDEPRKAMRGRRDRGGAYTGRFCRKGASEVGCVILSAAKDLRLARREILRYAQDDSLWRPARFKKPTRVRTLVVARCGVAPTRQSPTLLPSRRVSYRR